MEIIYPDDFIKFFNEDEEIDEVGEFEILPEEKEDVFTYAILDTAPKEDETRNSRNYDDDSKFYKLPPAVKNVTNNIKNIPSVIEDLPYALKDMGHNLAHSAPVSYVANMLPYPTNWQNPNSPSPLGPPPSYIPSKNDPGVQKNTKELDNPKAKNVSSNSIKFCQYRFTYIWQNNGRSYWAYITHVDKSSIAGWRFAGFRWVYFGVDLKRIDSFICY